MPAAATSSLRESIRTVLPTGSESSFARSHYFARFLGLVVATVLALETPAGAAELLGCTHDQGRPGDLAEVRIWAVTEFTANGWSFGLCHDPAVVELDTVEDGATTATVNAGGPPDFASFEIDSDGWATGVVINFIGAASLPPGDNHELNIASYLLIGSEGQSTALDFCGTVGAPPIAVVFVYSGASLAPEVVSPGSIEIETAEHAFYAPHINQTYHTPGFASFGVTLSAGAYSEPSSVTQGFSMSLGYDTDALTAISIEPAGPVAALPGGPDFFNISAYPGGLSGGVVYSLIGAHELFFGVETVPLVHVEFDATVDEELGGYFPLRWTDGIGPAPAPVSVVVGSGTSWIPVLRNGTVRLAYQEPLEFIRGDCASSGAVDLGDVFALLEYLFGTGSGAVDCQDACDANGDGLLHLGDPICLLEYLFQGGAAPPSPFPTCGAIVPVFGCVTSGCP